MLFTYDGRGICKSILFHASGRRLMMDSSKIGLTLSGCADETILSIGSEMCHVSRGGQSLLPQICRMPEFRKIFPILVCFLFLLVLWFFGAMVQLCVYFTFARHIVILAMGPSSDFFVLIFISITIIHTRFYPSAYYTPNALITSMIYLLHQLYIYYIHNAFITSMVHLIHPWYIYNIHNISITSMIHLLCP